MGIHTTLKVDIRPVEWRQVNYYINAQFSSVPSLNPESAGRIENLVGKEQVQLLP